MEAHTVDGLLGLLDALPALVDRDAVAEAASRAAVAESGTRAAALLIDRGDAVFEVWGASGEPLALDRLVLDELTSPLWPAPLGKGAVWWTAGDPGMVDAVEAAGWRRLLAVGVPLTGRRRAVLIAGDERDDPIIPEAARALARIAAAAGVALDRAAQSEERATLEQLLSAAVATAGQMVATGRPERLAQRFVAALVEDVGFAGTALWQPSGSDGSGLVLRASHGLPTEVTRQVATLAPDTMAAKLHDGRLPPPLARAGAKAAASSWPGYRVRLVVIPSPADGVLGVYHAEPLDSLVDGVLATLARTFAAAVHQTTLHAQARAVVDSLQQELRPSELPPLDSGIDVGWMYRSATTGVEVGGDFFDVVPTDTGHVGIACGDVSGKGVEAASLTAMAVHSLRAYALHGSTPGAVLRLLNAAVCAQTSPERFMTVAYVRLDPGSGRGQLALAGHPAPLRVRPDGHVEQLETAPDPPVGVEPEATFAERAIALAPGDSLVLYTDGVTEARKRSGDHAEDAQARTGDGGGELLGEQGLTRILAEAGDGDAQALADAVWTGVQKWTGGVTTDDSAVVVVRRSA